MRARAFRLSFISLISLSTSSMNLGTRPISSGVDMARTNTLLDDEIDNLVLQHRFGVCVGDKERDIIALSHEGSRVSRSGFR